MRKVIGATAAIIILVVGGGIAFAYSGTYDIGADSHHWPITYWVLQTVRNRSVEAHAGGIEVPDNLGNEKRVIAGTAHVSEHCALCHGAPGVEPDDLAEGMYPKPPNLAHAARHLSPAEMFWILKHGIKMTGMPSWADHGDNALWNIVAYLEKLPGMTPDEYQALVKKAAAAGGQHMHGMQGMDMGGGQEGRGLPAHPK